MSHNLKFHCCRITNKFAWIENAKYANLSRKISTDCLCFDKIEPLSSSYIESKKLLFLPSGFKEVFNVLNGKFERNP